MSSNRYFQTPERLPCTRVKLDKTSLRPKGVSARQEQAGSTRPVRCGFEGQPVPLRSWPRPRRHTPAPATAPWNGTAQHGTRGVAWQSTGAPDGRARPPPMGAEHGGRHRPHSAPAEPSGRYPPVPGEPRAPGRGRYPGPGTLPLVQGPLPPPPALAAARRPGPDRPTGPSQARCAVRSRPRCAALTGVAHPVQQARQVGGARAPHGRQHRAPRRRQLHRAPPRGGATRAEPRTYAPREEPRLPRARPPTRTRTTPTGTGPLRMLGLALRRTLPARDRAADWSRTWPRRPLTAQLRGRSSALPAPP